MSETPTETPAAQLYLVDQDPLVISIASRDDRLQESLDSLRQARQRLIENPHNPLYARMAQLAEESTLSWVRQQGYGTSQQAPPPEQYPNPTEP